MVLGFTQTGLVAQYAAYATPWPPVIGTLIAQTQTIGIACSIQPQAETYQMMTVSVGLV